MARIIRSARIVGRGRRVGKKFVVSTVYKKRKPAVVKARQSRLKKLIQGVINREAETKVAVSSFTLNPSSIQTGTTSMVGNYWVLNPSDQTSGYTLARGTGNYQMLGNRIRRKYARLSLAVVPNGYNVTTNPTLMPLHVRCYIYKSKNAPVGTPQVSDFQGASATFFENGMSYTGFSGTIMDMNRRINTEDFTYVAHRTFKIGNSIPLGAGTNSTPNYYFSNNDYKLNSTINWNITKYLPEYQTQSDNNLWQNPCVFLLWQVVPGDPAGGLLLANTVLPVNIQAQIEYKFQDF